MWFFKKKETEEVGGDLTHLVHQLQDPEFRTRESAAKALGESGSSKATDALVAALDDEKRVVRVRAADALEKLGWKPGKGPTATAFHLAKGDWEACVRVGSDAVEPLMDYVREDGYQIDQAAAALGKIGDRRAVAVLIELLNHEHEPYRSAAIQALLLFKDNRVPEALLSALDDEAPGVRREALGALDQMGWTPDTGRAGARYWSVRWLYPGSNETDENRARALERLRELDYEPGRTEADGAWHAAKGQWESCAEIGAPAVRPLFVLLQETDESLREKAGQALVGIGEDAVDLLHDCLEHYFRYCFTDRSGIHLRVRAAQVLGEIGSPRSIDALTEMSRSVERTLDHKKAAAEALGKIGEPAFQPMVDLLESDNAHDQQLAAWALGAIGKRQAVEALIPMVSTKPFHDSHVRKAAGDALRSLTGEDFGEDVEEWAAWWEKNG